MSHALIILNGIQGFLPEPIHAFLLDFFQCTHQEFANYSDLLHHTAYCHSNIKGFKCDFCPKRVTFPQTLQVHLAGTHSVRHKFEGLLQFIKKYGVFRDEKPSLQNLCPPLAPQAPKPSQGITTTSISVLKKLYAIFLDFFLESLKKIFGPLV